MNVLGCRCVSGDGGKRAWVDSGDDDVTYVHIQCLQPSHATIEGDDVLNLMRFGPHHHELHETHDLTQNGDNSWILDYRWTPELVTGSESGKRARVWVHKDSVAS